MRQGRAGPARGEPVPTPTRRRAWSVFVPVIAALAGLLATATAHTSAGTQLRDDRRLELTRLISERRDQVLDEALRASQLRRSIDQATATQAGADGPVAAERTRAERYRLGAGFTAVRGPGLMVRLDDAPRRPDGGLPAGARPDDVIVHQQDVQAVVNALWAGGAEAMTIMGIRVISTSAVRCVGNTLLLHGQVFSPPFTVRAIGDPDRLAASLRADPGVGAFAGAAAAFGLGYQTRPLGNIVAPAYAGSVTLERAKAATP